MNLSGLPHKPPLIAWLQRGCCGAPRAIRWVVGYIRTANAFKGARGERVSVGLRPEIACIHCVNAFIDI